MGRLVLNSAVLVAIALLLVVPAFALTVPKYATDKVDVSLSVLTGTPGAPSFCGQFDNTCDSDDSGVLMNCVPNGDATTCHCELWSCGGSGTTCQNGEVKCMGSGYEDGLACNAPGKFTYFCKTGVCNYGSRCGVVNDCSLLNSVSYRKAGEVGMLSNCRETTNSLECECDFSAVSAVFFLTWSLRGHRQPFIGGLALVGLLLHGLRRLHGPHRLCRLLRKLLTHTQLRLGPLMLKSLLLLQRLQNLLHGLLLMLLKALRELIDNAIAA